MKFDLLLSFSCGCDEINMKNVCVAKCCKTKWISFINFLLINQMLQHFWEICLVLQLSFFWRWEICHIDFDTKQLLITKQKLIILMDLAMDDDVSDFQLLTHLRNNSMKSVFLIFWRVNTILSYKYFIDCKIGCSLSYETLQRDIPGLVIDVITSWIGNFRLFEFSNFYINIFYRDLSTVWTSAPLPRPSFLHLLSEKWIIFTFHSKGWNQTETCYI